MTLLQMSYILEVDRCGSMNRAARNLFLSQSALSAAIADVERELGVTIFLRTNRGVVLSREGDEFLIGQLVLPEQPPQHLAVLLRHHQHTHLAAHPAHVLDHLIGESITKGSDDGSIPIGSF